MLPTRLFAAPIIVLAVPACGSSGSNVGDAGTVHCLSSRDGYCMHATPPCVPHLDPSRLLESFCEQFMAAGTVEPLDCPSLGAEGIVVSVVASGAVLVQRAYFYDLHSGDLIAVTDLVTDESVLTFGACVGGPPTLANLPCTDFLLGYSCFSDAGAPDAASE